MTPTTENASVFVQRVSQLPVVEAGAQKAGAIYQKAKESHRFINFGLSMAEGTFWFAVEKAKPIYKAVDAPILALDKLATQKLDELEHAYPVIGKSTDEILAESRRFIEAHPTLDKGYGMVVGLKNTSYEGLLGSVKATGEGVLDLTEKLVDKYVAPSTSTEHDKPTTVVGRISYIANKAQIGAKNRVLKVYVDLVADERVQQLSEQRVNAQEQATKMWGIAKAQTQLIRQNPAASMVFLIRGVSSISDAAFAQLLLVSPRYLPAVTLKPLSLTSAAVHQLNETVEKAEDLSGIRDELVIQVREKLTDVEDSFARLLDFVANLPPVATLVEAVSPLPTSGTATTGERVSVDDFARISENMEQ